MESQAVGGDGVRRRGRGRRRRRPRARDPTRARRATASPSSSAPSRAPSASASPSTGRRRSSSARLGFDVGALGGGGQGHLEGRRGRRATSPQPNVRAEIGFSAPFRTLMAARRPLRADHPREPRADRRRPLRGRARRRARSSSARGAQRRARGRRASTGLAPRRRPPRSARASTWTRPAPRRSSGATFGIGQDDIGPRKVVVRARFPHAYDGLGTRIRTDDTLVRARLDLGHQRLRPRDRRRHRGGRSGLRRAAQAAPARCARCSSTSA